MDIYELRKLVTNYPKFPGTKLVSPASVCNDGFPGNFNLSFTEAEMLKEYRQYVDYPNDLVYSKIQPVIRYNDFVNHISKHDSDSYRYLSVFDLADIGGSISLRDGNKRDGIIKYTLESFYNFLMEVVGLESDKLRISYFGGGNVKDATEGKYDLDYKIPSDPTISLWKKMGIKEEQFVPDYSRSTLLALNIYGKATPWGYRHEINYVHNNKLIDIGTFEVLFWRPNFENEKLVNLTSWEHAWAISAIGLERMLMIKNGFSRATDCDHIKPLIELILQTATNKDYQQAEILCQVLRVIHRIMSDCGGYENLSQKRKEKVRSFYKSVFTSSSKLNIKLTLSQLETFLNLNVNLQSFYPEFALSVTRTVQEILKGEERLVADRSIKNGGVAQ